MKAITTKYHGPTNARGSRVSASDEDGNRVSLSWDCALNSDNNHDAAAKALCVKMDWTRYTLVRAATKTGYVYAMDVPWERISFSDAEHAGAAKNAEAAKNRATGRKSGKTAAL